MGILLMAHSLTRWLIVAVAVVALVASATGLIRKSGYDKTTGGLMRGFSGLMDLQALMGIGLLLWMGLGGTGFPRYRLEHAITMIVAVVIGHLPARWKEKPAGLRYRNNLFVILGAMLLVTFGIFALPQGWLG